jgi:hypothetical protein
MRPLSCETIATGTLLKNIGINLSELLLFGFGEGLGFAIFIAIDKIISLL